MAKTVNFLSGYTTVPLVVEALRIMNTPKVLKADRSLGLLCRSDLPLSLSLAACIGATKKPGFTEIPVGETEERKAEAKRKDGVHARDTYALPSGTHTKRSCYGSENEAPDLSGVRGPPHREDRLQPHGARSNVFNVRRRRRAAGLSRAPSGSRGVDSGTQRPECMSRLRKA